MIIVRALYGLKSSGAAFRALLAETLHDLGYTPSLADQDVWLRPEVKENGFEYYEVILCYVDDVLSISHDPMKTMNGIRANFTPKDDKVEKPDIYLGALLDNMATADGVECWKMSPEKYCKSAVKNVEKTLNDHGRIFPTKCRAPLKYGYGTELDTTAELKAEGAQQYQELIGILRWLIEIGRIDILLEVSLTSM